MRTVVLLRGEDAGVVSVALDVAEFRGLKRRFPGSLPIGRAVVQSVREVDDCAKCVAVVHGTFIGGWGDRSPPKWDSFVTAQLIPRPSNKSLPEPISFRLAASPSSRRTRASAAKTVLIKFTASLRSLPEFSQVAPIRLSRNIPAMAASAITGVQCQSTNPTTALTHEMMHAATHPLMVPSTLTAPLVPIGASLKSVTM